MNGEQATLDGYASTLSAAARTEGERSSRNSDPDGSAEARRIILDLLDAGLEVTADDIRPRLEVGTPAVIGAAFGSLAREGLIEIVGYERSRAPSRHAGLVRRWGARA